MTFYSAEVFTVICPKCRREVSRQRGNLHNVESVRRILRGMLVKHQSDPKKCRAVPTFTITVKGPMPPLGYYSWHVVGTDLRGGVGGGDPRSGKRRALEAGREALNRYLNKLMNSPSQDEHGQGD